jgi:hypothetical protein
VCSISATVKFEVPDEIMLVIAEKEGGCPAQLTRNNNGTDDTFIGDFLGLTLYPTATHKILWS